MHLFYKRSSAPFKTSIKHWVIGSFLFVLFEACYYCAFYFASALKVDLITYIWPTIVIVLNKTQGSKRSLYFASAIGFLGVFLIFNPSIEFNKNEITGCILALIGALSWSIYVLYHVKNNHLPSEMVTVYCFFAGLITLFSHFFFENLYLPEMGEWVLIGILGFGISGSAYILWDIGIKKGSVNFLSICSYFTPLFSVGFLIIFAGEQMNLRVIISGILILISTLLAQKQIKQKVDVQGIVD